MFENALLDPREREIFEAADEWWATRFAGRGHYNKLGPFPTSLDVVRNVLAFFRLEEHNYPPPESVSKRPFAVYAASSKHGGSHVIVGNVYRDGVHRPTHKEVSTRIQEEKLVAKKRRTRRRHNTDGTA